MNAWLLAYLALAISILAAGSLFWGRKADLAAYIYIYKGAIWFFWIASWLFFLIYLAARPASSGFIAAFSSPIKLGQSMLALLGTLVAVYLSYLVVVYPFFASLRPSLSKENPGIDWQLDIHIEDKVIGLLEEAPAAPLALLNMGLADALLETPPDERLAMIGNLWRHYVPVITSRRAAGIVHLPSEGPSYEEPDLNRVIRLAMDVRKVAANQGDEERKCNAAAMPLLASGRVQLILAACWPRRRGFKTTYDRLMEQFGIVRSQYIIAAEVRRERLELYDDPWNDADDGE